jgi:hypothetical protein
MEWLGKFIPVFKDMFTQLEDFFGKVPAAMPEKQ